ncbi:MAG TPA: hypothetical protein VGK48_09960 [Terriglobia bacterium]|jgi:hypothetical protein
MSSNEEDKHRGHEHSDWNLNWVLGGVITLVISVAVMLSASWWIFREFQGWAANRRMGTVVVPLAPPEPRLQVSSTDDWTAMLEREQAILHSYGWVDRSRGIVRIPIEREMELVAKRGFPAAPVKGGPQK